MLAPANYTSILNRLKLVLLGARNALLLEVLASLVAVPVASTSELHIDPQQVEACAFAWFGYCFLNRRTASLPTVTGARRAKLLGALWPAS
ncbi:MAG: hypothetical protein FJY46_11795 [Betaproteobacteria bacterium]|nr:hypothetical protein [Betaproteobacteria bacterium]